MKQMCSGYLCTSRIPLFSELDEAEQQKIASSAEHFEKGPFEVVIRESEKANFILVIREGKVKLNTFDADGREYILGIKSESHMIGEEYLLKNTVFDYSAETLAPTKFCKISTDILFLKAMENPVFAGKIIHSLSSELQKANNMLRIIMESDALRRMCGILLHQSRHSGNDELFLSLDEIAGISNLRRETVSRKLKQLEQEGCIRRTGHKKVKILDAGLLEKIFYEI